MTFNGVDQSTALGSFASSEGDSAAPSTTVTSATDELVFGVLSADHNADVDLIPGAGQTEHWDLFRDKATGGGTTESGAASVDTSWSLPLARKWAAGGVSIRPAAVDALWLSTSGDVASPSGVPGLDSWASGELLNVGDPNLALGPGTTDGTLSSIFNLDNLVDDGNATLDALHYVDTSITVGGANAVNLQSGDILFSTGQDENYDGGSLTIEERDVGLFRPDTPGDYSSGTFSILLDDLSVGGFVGPNVHGITLVEQNTVFGDTTLNAGDFVYTHLDDFSANIVYLFEVNDVGAGTTSGTHNELIDGDDIGLSVFSSFLIGQRHFVAIDCCNPLAASRLTASRRRRRVPDAPTPSACR